MRPSTQKAPSIKAERELYYTNNHEWIDFHGLVAYIGVCKFKLTGFYQIHKFLFKPIVGLYKQGDVIGCLSYNDYTIDVQMPVDGSIELINEALLPGDNSIVVEQPESKGWIAEIFPSSPYNHNGLLDYEDYRMKQYKRQFG